MRLRSYRDLEVWCKAFAWAEAIYLNSKGFPAEERYGLTSQLRRAAISVPANIAEGAGRATTKDLLRFLSIAHGSLAETETLLMLARNFQLLSPAQASTLLSDAEEIGRMLNGLRGSLQSRLRATNH
jgi:four helix bundle protein